MATTVERQWDWGHCPGQVDLLDLVDTEHLHGTLPAHPGEAEAARQAFYRDWAAHLKDRRARDQTPSRSTEG